LLRGGEGEVGGVSQSALPGAGELLPFPVAVIYYSAVLQMIQQMDVSRICGPEEGLMKSTAGGFLLHEPTQTLLSQKKQVGKPFVGDENRRKGIYRDIGTNLSARFFPGRIPKRSCRFKI
jgi:hypothetical protein